MEGILKRIGEDCIIPEFITPIQPLQFGEGGIITKKATTAEETVGSFFKDYFYDAINNVEMAERDLENKEYLLATGQIDDAHTVPIAQAELQLSVDLLGSLRNKAVETFNELMRMSI